MPKSSWEFLTGGKVDAEQQEKKEEVRLARERLAEFGTSKSCPWRPDEITTITNSLAHFTKQKERLTRTTRRCKPCSSKCENTSRRSCAHQGLTTQNRRAIRPTKSSTNDAGSTSRKKQNKERQSTVAHGIFCSFSNGCSFTSSNGCRPSTTPITIHSSSTYVGALDLEVQYDWCAPFYKCILKSPLSCAPRSDSASPSLPFLRAGQQFQSSRRRLPWGAERRQRP